MSSRSEDLSCLDAMKPKSRRSIETHDTLLLSVPGQYTSQAPDLLRHLDASLRTQVLALGTTREYRNGEFLFHQGEAHDGIFLIEEGSVKSFYVSEDGRELTLGYWSAGHYVGAPQLFGGGVHAWTSVAASRTRCLWLPGSRLRALSQQHGELAVALIEAMVHKMQCYCALLQLLATHSMRVRLARLLSMLAARTEGQHATISLSHSELAGMIGSTRQWVSLSLTRFESAGWVERQPDGTYLVRNRNALVSIR